MANFIFKRICLGSFQTCLYIQGAQVHLIIDQKVPYAITENQWVGFDNKGSFEKKVIDYLNL